MSSAKRMDRDEIIAEGIRLSSKHHIVTKKQWDKNRSAGAPSSQTVVLQFGSWQRFAEECGKYPNMLTDSQVGEMQSRVFMPKKRRGEPQVMNNDFFAERHVPSVGR